MQKGKVIVYASRQLKDFESRYLTHDLKLVVVIFALKFWRHYFYGMKCNVYTYHISLKYLFTENEFTMRQRQWLELVKDYNCEIRYYPWKVKVVVNALIQKAFLSHIIVQKELQYIEK